MKIELLLLISIFIDLESANGGSERKETLKKTLSVGQFCSEFSLDGYSVNELKKEALLLGNSSWRHLRLKYAELYGPEELVKFMDLYDMKVAFKMLNDPKNVYKNYPNILYVLKLYHLTLQDEKKEEFLEKLNKKDSFLRRTIEEAKSFPDLYFTAPSKLTLNLALFENSNSL